MPGGGGYEWLEGALRRRRDAVERATATVVTVALRVNDHKDIVVHRWAFSEYDEYVRSTVTRFYPRGRAVLYAALGSAPVPFFIGGTLLVSVPWSPELHEGYEARPGYESGHWTPVPMRDVLETPASDVVRGLAAGALQAAARRFVARERLGRLRGHRAWAYLGPRGREIGRRRAPKTRPPCPRFVPPRGDPVPPRALRYVSHPA
eukprot:tig00000492_g1553.t1